MELDKQPPSKKEITYSLIGYLAGGLGIAATPISGIVLITMGASALGMTGWMLFIGGFCGFVLSGVLLHQAEKLSNIRRDEAIKAYGAKTRQQEEQVVKEMREKLLDGSMRYLEFINLVDKLRGNFNQEVLEGVRELSLDNQEFSQSMLECCYALNRSRDAEAKVAMTLLQGFQRLSELEDHDDIIAFDSLYADKIAELTGKMMQND